MFLSHLNFTVCSNSEFNLNNAILQHLDEECYLVLMHYSLNTEDFSTRIEPKQGYYLLHSPPLNVSSQKEKDFQYPLPDYGRGILTQPQKSRIPCLIALIITRRTDFDLDSTQKKKHLRFLSNFQLDTMEHFIYGEKILSWGKECQSQLNVQLMMPHHFHSVFTIHLI